MLPSSANTGPEAAPFEPIGHPASVLPWASILVNSVLRASMPIISPAICSYHQATTVPSGATPNPGAPVGSDRGQPFRGEPSGPNAWIAYRLPSPEESTARYTASSGPTSIDERAPHPKSFHDDNATLPRTRTGHPARLLPA